MGSAPAVQIIEQGFCARLADGATLLGRSIAAPLRSRTMPGWASSASRAILEAHKGPRRLKADAVRSYLKRDPLPSLRRVQEVVREQRRQTGA